MKNTDIYISSKDSKEGDKRKFYRVSNQAVIESLNSEEKLNICEFLAEYEMTFFEIKELIDEVWGLFYIEDNALMLPYHLLSRISVFFFKHLSEALRLEQFGGVILYYSIKHPHTGEVIADSHELIERPNLMLKGTLTNKVIEVNELESYADKLGYCLISKKEVKDEI